MFVRAKRFKAVEVVTKLPGKRETIVATSDE